MKTYVYPVEVEAEQDGRYHAWCPALKGCHTWGKTQQEAVRFIGEAVHAYIQDLLKAGEGLPEEGGVEVLDRPAVSVTV